MKKLILGILSLVIFNNVFSQDYFLLPKSSKLVGGRIYLNYQIPDISSNSIRRFELKVLPNFGYAIKDNLIVGGNISYNYDRIKYTDLLLIGNLTNAKSQLGIGVYINKYTLKHIYYGLSTNFYLWNFYDSFSLIPRIGYAIQLNPNTLFQIQFNNVLSFNKDDSEFRISSSTMLGCGFQIVL